jgi:hypothetical protein
MFLGFAAKINTVLGISTTSSHWITSEPDLTIMIN